VTKFFAWLADNTLFVHYITIVIVMLGLYSFTKVQREARPNVDFNRVAISAVYPGASPQDIEELVIDPIEEKIEEVDGIEEYRSVSFNGAGAISVKIDDEYPDPRIVIDDLRRKITEVRDIPLEVEDPLVTEIKASNIPVLRIALFGEATPYEFKLELEKLKDFLKKKPGVQSVDDANIQELQLKILTSPEKLDQYDITLIEMITSLGQWSRQKPGGLFETNSETVSMNVGDDYNELDKINEFVIRSNDSGRSVVLKNIAKVDYDLESTQLRTLFEDKSAVALTVVKKPFADIVTTVDLLNEAITEYEKKLPKGLGIKVYTDQSVLVRNRLSIVTSNAIFGLALVILILMISLDFRSALVTSLGLPIAVIGGLAIVFYLGNTLNSLVIVGLVIVLGMLVDDATVVCENIYSYVEKGFSPKEAAIKGVSEIAVPVMASVLTTVFAFFPILFMKEIIGQFLRVIPLTVIAMLFMSLVEALIISPIHAAEVMTVSKKKKKIGFIQKLEARYKRYVVWSIGKRPFVLLFFILFFGVSIFQGKKLFEQFTIFPATGLEGLTVRLELEKNIPIDDTAEKSKGLIKRLQKVSEGTFESIYATVGEVVTGGNSNGSRQNGSHLANITVVFTSDPSFYKMEDRVVSNMRKVTEDYAKSENIKTSITLDRPGPPQGKPIQLEIASRDIDKGRKISDLLKAEFAKMKGVNSLETDLDGATKKYRFVIDNDLAVAEGVSPNEISQTVFAASTGRVAEEILKNNEKIEILVGVNPTELQDIQKILDLKVRNINGQAIKLKAFVKVIEERGPSSIQRLNGLRTITLFGEVDEDIISGRQANINIAPLIAKLSEENPDVSIGTGGGEKDRMNALLDTRRLYIIALILIFLVISLSFQSVLYPILVVLTIPMGLCGVVWALRLHGQPLSIMGIIGVVGLSGVVVNTSILLLSFVQQGIKEGMTLTEAIAEAGSRRLRAIMITTSTTLIGLFPTMYGIGGKDYFIQPIALVLGWGLLVATLLTLFGLPALISFVKVLEKKPKPE
jgi:multidrug efflux pump subunit AcrB